MNKPAATPAAPKGQGHTQARARAPEVCPRETAPELGLHTPAPEARLHPAMPEARLFTSTPEARLHAATPEPGSWLHVFLAFLLQLAGLLPQPNTQEGRHAAQALREFQDLLARYQRGELPLPTRHTHRTGELRPRLPRAQRRILLTPGLYAALYFTPRAAIAARARITARAGQLATAQRARSQTSVSIFGHHTQTPNCAFVIPISQY